MQPLEPPISCSPLQVKLLEAHQRGLPELSKELWTRDHLRRAGLGPFKHHLNQFNSHLSSRIMDTLLCLDSDIINRMLTNTLHLHLPNEEPPHLPELPTIYILVLCDSEGNPPQFNHLLQALTAMKTYATLQPTKEMDRIARQIDRISPANHEHQTESKSYRDWSQSDAVRNQWLRKNGRLHLFLSILLY